MCVCVCARARVSERERESKERETQRKYRCKEENIFFFPLTFASLSAAHYSPPLLLHPPLRLCNSPYSGERATEKRERENPSNFFLFHVTLFRPSCFLLSLSLRPLSLSLPALIRQGPVITLTAAASAPSAPLQDEMKNLRTEYLHAQVSDVVAASAHCTSINTCDKGEERTCTGAALAMGTPCSSADATEQCATGETRPRATRFAARCLSRFAPPHFPFPRRALLRRPSRAQRLPPFAGGGQADSVGAARHWTVSRGH